MWRIEERRVDKQLDGMPQEILKQLREVEGHRDDLGSGRPQENQGLHDESLAGEWKGHRSSRLGLQYRIIYSTIPVNQTFQVVSITAHDYRRR
jgi:mRNA-degrading endonuclease YafQ of YafQ-DinJ toxin-antitoxin module